jgi:hypothetical protein
MKGLGVSAPLGAPSSTVVVVARTVNARRPITQFRQAGSRGVPCIGKKTLV